MSQNIIVAELLADPLGLGYAMQNEATAFATITNANRSRTRETVSGAEIFNATSDTEFDQLTDAQKDRWLQLCQISDVDVNNGVARAIEDALFGANTTTRTNLAALITETIDRATEIGVPNLRRGVFTAAYTEAFG